MKVAVVSSDGKVINQHFGRASRFLIYEINCGDIQFIEAREITPLCGLSDKGNMDDVLGRSISLITDCKALFCARIGRRPKEELRKKGIKLIEAPFFIHEALKNLEITQLN
jgi:nitrogen fixation protein NifX